MNLSSNRFEFPTHQSFVFVWGRGSGRGHCQKTSPSTKQMSVADTFQILEKLANQRGNRRASGIGFGQSRLKSKPFNRLCLSGGLLIKVTTAPFGRSKLHSTETIDYCPSHFSTGQQPQIPAFVVCGPLPLEHPTSCISHQASFQLWQNLSSYKRAEGRGY
jgi:hypothetical protein